jgi:hypothetical protein
MKMEVHEVLFSSQLFIVLIKSEDQRELLHKVKFHERLHM